MGSVVRVELCEKGDKMTYSFDGIDMVSTIGEEERERERVILVGYIGRRTTDRSSHVVVCRYSRICEGS